MLYFICEFYKREAFMFTDCHTVFEMSMLGCIYKIIAESVCNNFRISDHFIIVYYYMMAGRAFVVANEVFYHSNRDNIAPSERLNNEKQCLFT